MGSKRNTIIADIEMLPQEDIADVYKQLAEKYTEIKEENDKFKQELHHQKIQTKMLASSQNDLQNELDSISNVHKQEISEIAIKNVATIESFKEKNHELLTDKVQLETKVQDLSNLVTDLQKQCQEKDDRIMNMRPPPRVSDGFARTLEIENENLRQMYESLQSKLDEAELRSCSQNTMCEELKERILCLEDNLESRKTDIEEKNDAIECLQEELNDLTVELAMLKSAPDDQNRKGNSLFSEVDDQRKQMKTILQGERAHYLEMKKIFNAKEMEIRRLKRENLNIKQEISACSGLLMRGEKVSFQALASQVTLLQNDNKRLESLLTNTEMKLIDLAKEQNNGWIESLIEGSGNEARAMKDKLFSLMIEKTSLADNFNKSHRELAKARLDCVKLKIFLGRIIVANSIKIDEREFYEIGLDEEVLENLKVEDFETVDGEQDELDMYRSAGDTGNLNESTIALIGGRECLANFVEPQTLNLNNSKRGEKENQSKNAVKVAKPIRSPVKPLQARQLAQPPIKPVQVEPLLPPNQELKHEATKTVTFTNNVQVKVIDTTVEQFEQSQQMRKRPGLVVKRIVIPSKSSTKKPENL